MSLISWYFYSDLPTGGDIYSMLISACVHDGGDGAGNTDLVGGLLKAYVAACWADLDGDEDHPGITEFLDSEEAEKLYLKTFIKAFNQYASHHSKNWTYDPESGMGWWPESMSFKESYPKKVIIEVAIVMASTEVARAKSAFDYMKAMDKKKKAGLKQEEVGA